MKIKFEKIIDQQLGVAVKVTGIEGFLSRDILPEEYLEISSIRSPFCYLMTESSIHLVFDNEESEIITVGDIFGKQYFENITKALRECAEKLHEIREDERREVENGWKGEETYEFCGKTIRRID